MLIPFGTMSSANKGPDAALSLSFNTRTYERDTSGIVKNSENANNTMTTSLSAGSVGDLAILWERRINSASAVVPAINLNSGWTSIGSYSVDASREFREDFSYKIMTSSDISSGTVTTGKAEFLSNTLLFFTPNKAISSIDVNGFSDNDATGTISDQTQRPETQSDAPPVIIFYTKTTHNPRTNASNTDVDCAIGGTAGTAMTASGNNSFFETVARQTGGPSGEELHMQNDDSRIGYIIQNFTLQNVQSNPTDEGGRQTTIDFHLEVT